MRYGLYLVSGFFRAIFWSGGLPWGIPKLLIIIGALPPAVGFGQQARTIVNFIFNIPVEEIESWWFYIGGFVAIGAVLAARLAYLETTRICLDGVEIFNDGANIEWVRVGIQNISYRSVNADFAVRLLSIDRWPEYSYDQPIDLPIVLTSQERMRHGIDNDEAIQYGKMNLDAGAPPKKIELFQVINKSKIEIRHQGGTVRMTLGNHLMKYEALASGSKIIFYIKCFYFRNSYSYILARDEAMLYAFEILGNRELAGRNR